MRGIIKSVLVTIAAILGVVLLALTTTFTSAVTLAATAIIVPGTGTPNPTIPTNYMNNAVNYYVIPSTAAAINTQLPVMYPAQFWPIPLPGWGGLSGAKWNVSVGTGVKNLGDVYDTTSGDVVVFGYSQGSTISSLFKQQLINPSTGEIPSDTSFVLIGNPQRPNGGFFERWAILGTVPILDATFGQPTPNTGINPDGSEIPDFPINTTDIALQYDGVADFPTYPIFNPLASANAIAGFAYIHGTYLAPDGDEVTETPLPTPYGYEPSEIQGIIAECRMHNDGPNCQKYGDTLYVTIPARVLPIMQPALDIGAATGTSALVIPVVDLISPFTQTLIETGYDRTNYGVPTPARLIPRIDPVTLAGDLIQDIPEGIHAALNPGLDPLPGSGSTPSVTTVEKKSATTSRRPLIPVNLIAKPNLLLGANKPGGQTSAKLFGANVHPIRDAVQTVTGVVKKVLGPTDNAGDTGAAA